MLGNLIGGFVAILVGTSLMPSVSEQVYLARFESNSSGSVTTNTTGAASTILGLTTLFFALGIAAVGISLAAQGLRAAGLLGR